MGSVSVRFSSQMMERVSELSLEFQLPVAEVVRRAVESQLPVWESRQTPGLNEAGQDGKT